VLQEGSGGRKYSSSSDGAALLQPELFRAGQYRVERLVSLSHTAEFAGASICLTERFVASFDYAGTVPNWTTTGSQSQVHSTSRTPDLNVTRP